MANLKDLTRDNRVVLNSNGVGEIDKLINSNKNLRDLTKKIEKIEMTPAQKGSLAKLFAHGDTNIQKEVKELLAKGDKDGILKKINHFSNKNDIAGISESVVNGECASIQRVAYGEQYTRRNGKKSLKSNIEYVSQNGYKYSTDSSGRISHAEGSLKPGKATRNAYAQRTVGKGNGRLKTDDGGHLIATIFKGSGDLDNLVPMEYSWARALDRGDEVYVKIDPIYDNISLRPKSFKVKYRINNGRWKKSIFINKGV